MKKVLLWFVLLVASLGKGEALAQGPGYVIITTTNIISTSTQLTNFVASKQARGFTVQVVSNSPTGQGGWGGGTGDTAANNIRTWLQGHYTNANAEVVIDYVLLVGNPTSSVPMKICYPQSTNEGCPTDFYYADLTGNWDVNSNGYYGEYSDYTNGGPDRAYEVAVGRIPDYGNTPDLDKILSKIVTYENTPATNANWRNRAILDMGQLNMWTWGNEFGPSQIIQPILDPNGWYAKAFFYNTTPNYEEANVLTEWTNSSYGAVFFLGHGTADGTTLTTWILGGGMRLFGLESIALLHDEKPAFSFFCACDLAKPESTNNLSYSLLRNGGASVVGATAQVWFLYGIGVDPLSPGTSLRIEKDYVSRLVAENMAGGDALCDLKADNAPFTGSYPEAWWMNYLAFNLYGCPDVGIRSVRFSGPVWSF
jgi:hypothetical protein